MFELESNICSAISIKKANFDNVTDLITILCYSTVSKYK